MLVEALCDKRDVSEINNHNDSIYLGDDPH